MELITPGIGLVFWTALVFVLLLFLLTKFAWKPILQALNDREKSIGDALSAAENARKEIASLKGENEKLLAEARIERDKIIKDAQALSNQMINEAREKANTDGARLIETAKKQIQSEKNAAITELKNLVATTSIEIAEQILRKKLEDAGSQQDLIQKYLKETKFN